MKSPTHLLIGHLTAKLLPGDAPQRSRWMMIGAVAPDLPMVLVSVYCAGQSFCWTGSGLNFAAFVARVDHFYFDTPLFISVHHMLHSPLALAFIALAWRSLAPAMRHRFRAIAWLLMGMATHSVADMLSHASDGMLVFWPLNWTYRLNIGLDQWNMAGSGLILVVAETLFCLAYGSYILWERLLKLPVMQQKSGIVQAV